MAQQQRRPAQRATSSSTDRALYPVRKLPSRRGPQSRRRVFTIPAAFSQTSRSHGSVASSSPPDSPRAVLVPLHFNLRRLPSRSFLDSKDSMHDAVPTGSKRKRAVSGSENALANNRSRSGNMVKRRRASNSSDEDEDAASSMDVDGHTRWELTDSDASDDEDVDSSDGYLINEAPRRQLLRLRKDELVRLYAAAGLTEEAELLTKPEIVDCIIASRDDIASLPPSSPPEAGSSGSSDYSSDGGHVAGGEETDIGRRFRNGLSRRNTMHDLSRRSRRPSASDRCYSLPQIQQSERTTRVSQFKTVPSGTRRSQPR
ncbi:hypothetical protein PHLGIDRAFT_357502 [Phlebiopsis gigantea 11061_1 CR5-6]|uniref:Uncharacterized protein n=1 Tax=Phlebiopsis gigantea (strain 11061_1 CR5-6) TaxID=745531 RepID=A0A0C3S1C5_PHLG1|nr:hypothetical protein PHLGIDRAFT_357502 [Phlebiopsis gigantea 11061_1 CR5-6]